MSEKAQKLITLLVGVLAMSLTIGCIVFAWVEPTAPPPGDNVPAPINVGLIAQTKIGALGLGSIDLNYMLTIETSTLGILKVTNKGTGYTLYLEDEEGDTTPFVIDGNGNVGIGTTSPTQKLDVIGGVNATMFCDREYDVCVNPLNNAWLHVRNKANDAYRGLAAYRLYIEQSGTYTSVGPGGELRIQDGLIVDGNVGIGTSPNAKLDVNGNARIGTNLGVGVAPSTSYGIYSSGDFGIRADGSIGGGYFYDTDGTSWAQLAVGGYAIYSEGGAGVVARGSAYGGQFYDTDGTSRVFLARESYGIYQDIGSWNYFYGKVGIGTVDPGTNKLKVVGDTEITGNLTVGGTKSSIVNTS